MSVNNYEAFAKQVEFLLKGTNDKIKDLSKKDAIKMLEFVLKFPVEHEKIAEKLTKPEHKGIINHIIEVTTAKNNMVISFLHENGNELHQQALIKKAEEAELLKKKEPEEMKEPCDGCEDCNCGGKE